MPMQILMRWTNIMVKAMITRSTARSPLIPPAWWAASWSQPGIWNKYQGEEYDYEEHSAVTIDTSSMVGSLMQSTSHLQIKNKSNKGSHSNSVLFSEKNDRLFIVSSWFLHKVTICINVEYKMLILSQWLTSLMVKKIWSMFIITI